MTTGIQDVEWLDATVCEQAKRIAELEAALRPFALSAEMMKNDERTDEDVADLVCGTDLSPSDFWAALHVMTKSASST